MTREELLQIAKPILFNTEMVRAILDGRKTVTRRLVKTQPTERITCGQNWEKLLVAATEPYQPEDTIYVRETWRVGAWDILNQMIAFDYKDGTCGNLTYVHERELFERLVNQSREDARKAKCEYNGADFVWEKGKSPCRWRPSIHMPKEAARIWLKVKDVRVERLQDITEEQARAEGAKKCYEQINQIEDSPVTYLAEDGKGYYVLGFKNIWNSTIKKSDIEHYGWNENPWVWVIEFERIKAEENKRRARNV